MTDIVDQQTRSRMMAGIRGQNTKPELIVRKALHARGFRFRIHTAKILGRPDIALPRYRAVIFVHGCFWHRHEGCRYATSPSTRPDFWNAKFAANIARDNKVRQDLTDRGWRVATIWECALKNKQEADAAIERLSVWLKSDEKWIEVG